MRVLISVLSIVFMLMLNGTSLAQSTMAYETSFSRQEIKRSIYILTAVSRDKGEIKSVRRPVSLNTNTTADLDVLSDKIYELQQTNSRKYESIFFPLVIARHESGFRNLRGDHHLSTDGSGVSCGITQIRTDFEGRPSCQSLLRSPAKALQWTHDHINRLYSEKYCILEGRCLSRYAGSGPKAREFEQWVIDVSHYVERHLEQERDMMSCNPVDLPVM